MTTNLWESILFVVLNKTEERKIKLVKLHLPNPVKAKIYLKVRTVYLVRAVCLPKNYQNQAHKLKSVKTSIKIK